MTFTRRAFGASFLSSLAACSIPTEQQVTILRSCAAQREGPLTIDMHCHIMNSRDINAQAFVNRRVANTDEISPTLDFGLGVLVGTALVPFELFTKTANAEAEELAELIKSHDNEHTIFDFCDHANQDQRGFTFSDTDALKGDDGSRVTGFFSNRARNASLMAALWPEVDIFMPSIVDLYEEPSVESDTVQRSEQPGDQAKFYKQLHLATLGRFLPMISFSPQRAWAEEKMHGKGYDPLHLVRKSIVDDGFVGVKLHPSSGFNPHSNGHFGCNNSALQATDWEPGQTDAYDEYLEKLFAFCDEKEVPIMTHGSDSRIANTACSRRHDDPKEWTNSPYHWAEAVSRHEGLKVVLAHFASGFQEQAKEDTKNWCNFGENGGLEPSHWLREALYAMGTEKGRNLYVDISDMTFLAESQASKGVWSGPGCGENGRYAQAFGRYMRQTQDSWRDADGGRFHSRILYGTDYHMPSVAKIGNRYLPLIMDAIPYEAEEKADIRGRNAAKVYGLQRGGENRKRLQKFYMDHGLSLDRIAWMQRVDDEVSA